MSIASQATTAVGRGPFCCLCVTARPAHALTRRRRPAASEDARGGEQSPNRQARALQGVGTDAVPRRLRAVLNRVVNRSLAPYRAIILPPPPPLSSGVQPQPHLAGARQAGVSCALAMALGIH